MTTEALRHYLKSVREQDAEIDRMHNQLRSLETEATHITARYGAEAVMHTRNIHAMEDILLRKIDLEHAMDAAIDSLVATKRGVREMFDRLSRPEYAQIMTLHYLDYHSWSEIAKGTGYASSSTKRWHAQALEEIVKFLNLIQIDTE